MAITVFPVLYHHRWLITIFLLALVLVASAAVMLGPIMSFNAIHHSLFADAGRRTLSF